MSIAKCWQGVRTKGAQVSQPVFGLEAAILAETSRFTPVLNLCDR